MPDDLSLGEVQRNMARQDREMEAIRTQVTNLARESVTVTQFAQELGSLRRELATDRAATEELARERHKTMIDRLDRMDKNNGEQIKTLDRVTSERFTAIENREAARPMATWQKVGIVGMMVVGMLGVAVSLILGFTHH